MKAFLLILLLLPSCSSIPPEAQRVLIRSATAFAVSKYADRQSHRENLLPAAAVIRAFNNEGVNQTVLSTELHRIDASPAGSLLATTLAALLPPPGPARYQWLSDAAAVLESFASPSK